MTDRPLNTDNLIRLAERALEASRQRMGAIKQSGKASADLSAMNREVLRGLRAAIVALEAVEKNAQTEGGIIDILLGHLVEELDASQDHEHNAGHVLTFIKNLNHYVISNVIGDPEFVKLYQTYVTPQEAAYLRDILDQRAAGDHGQ